MTIRVRWGNKVWVLRSRRRRVRGADRGRVIDLAEYRRRQKMRAWRRPKDAA